MRKILISIITIFCMILIGCNGKISNIYNISTTVFVDSAGIDYNKETKKYTLYYHSPSSFALITSEMGSGGVENTYHIAKTECDSIYDGIKIIAQNSERSILLTHIRSFIFTENFLTIDNLNMFNEFIKTYKYITTDFAIYTTKDKIDEIYSLRNTDNNSYYSILTELDNTIPYKTIKYYEFANAAVEPHRQIMFQTIKKNDNIWESEKDKLTSVQLNGMTLVKDEEILTLDALDYKFILIMYNNYYTTINIENTSFNLINTSFSITEKKVKIKSEVYATNVGENNSEELIGKLEKYIINLFEEFFYETASKGYDPFQIKDLLYRKGKLKDDFNLETISFKYDINLKLLN